MTQTLKLQKWGNSQGIRISKEILESLGVTELENIEFEYEIKNQKILLEPKLKLSPYAKIFENYD